MKTPSFWYEKKPNIFQKITLLPLSYLYYTVFLILRKLPFLCGKRVIRLSTTVVCVGNINAGGSGKTIICQFLGEQLSFQKNLKICFATRGYRRSVKGFTKLCKGIEHNPYEYGDEPCLLSQTADVFLYEKVAELTSIIGYDVIIMDDGLQNFRLHKDCTILVEDFHNRTGSGFMLPLGPMRCNMSDVKYDFFVRLNKSSDKATGEDVINTVISLAGITECVIVSGLGQNNAFENSIKSLGIKVPEKYYFEDHFHYTRKSLEEVLKSDLPIVTTEKDMVKISQILRKEELGKFYVAKIQIMMNDITNSIVNKVVSDIASKNKL